jgi:hypothetical protein
MRKRRVFRRGARSRLFEVRWRERRLGGFVRERVRLGRDIRPRRWWDLWRRHVRSPLRFGQSGKQQAIPVPSASAYCDCAGHSGCEDRSGECARGGPLSRPNFRARMQLR